jgi:SAM-dependent methyltransferase
LPASIHGFLAFAPNLATENEEGLSETAFERLHRVEMVSFWFKARNQIILWALNTYFPQIRLGGSFLEIGCGTGYVLGGIMNAMPKAILLGSELSVSGLPFAQQRSPSATFFQMDARTFPFRDEFDVIGAFDVLEHVREDEQVMREMFAAAKPGGGVLISVPQHQWLWSAADDYAKHFRRYSRTEMINKLTQAGFRVQQTTSFVSLLVPLMLLSRLKMRDISKYDPSAEHRTSPLMNNMLGRVMDIERGLIRSKLSLPIGGSLLAIATKPI